VGVDGHLVEEMYMNMYIHGMAHRYSIAQARTNLPAIVDQAEAGLTVELTRRGKPVAVVVSLREFERSRTGRAGFTDLYRTFLETHALDTVGLEAGFAASLRDKAPGRKVSW
jgi:prevent-host-death family protein